MKGKLTHHPLAELIREISTKGLSGTLRLDHDQARTAIYFERGVLVFAASNIRNLRLREYLTKKSLVSKKELGSFGENGSDIALANALRANGALTQTQVDGLLAGLVADVLRVALLWTEGNWAFDERTHLGDEIRINLDIATLMREAAHRMPLKFVAQRFRNPAETLSRAPQVANDIAFIPAESFILSRLDAPTPLEQLVALSGLRELDALRTIYGLALGGAIKRQFWQPAFRGGVRAQTPEDVEEVIPAAEPPPQGPWTLDDRDANLEQFLQRIDHAADYYELLDITPNADADQIKEAYYAVARRYHPDRFHLKSGTSMHSRLGSAFAQVTQAYETLSDPERRASYDATLERKRQFASSAPKPTAPPPRDEEFDDDLDIPASDLGHAEGSFREGFGALQQGRINAALPYLAAAARLKPGDARYRAYYGRALAANERTRRLAENEIQAAVTIEPSNAVYRTMLAELYFDLKFQKRAKTELKRALELEPNNAAAILLQRKMDRSQKG
jgi:curved DNA-binding protein CbpA